MEFNMLLLEIYLQIVASYKAVEGGNQSWGMERARHQTQVERQWYQD